MNIKLILGILIFIVMILIGQDCFIFIKQKEIYNIKKEINSLILQQTNSKDKVFIDLTKQYIISQNQIKEMWWDTIINQSGLSIIFTAIIILITITVGYIANKEFDKTLEKNSNEFKDYLSLSISDFQNIIFPHRGNTSGKLSETNLLRKNYLDRVNCFNNLKNLKKTDFIDLYYEDIELIAEEILDKSKYNIPPHNDIPPREIIEFFNKITNQNDKINIIKYIQDMHDKFESKYPGETQDNYNFCKEGLKILIKELSSHLEVTKDYKI